MGRNKRRSFVAVALAGLAAAVVWTSELRRVVRILGECLRPTTVEMMPLPKGCIPTTAAPPANLMWIVDSQESLYHLTRQKLVVCITALCLPRIEPDFSEAAFDQEVRKRWPPLYVGCCSYQFGGTSRWWLLIAMRSEERSVGKECRS